MAMASRRCAQILFRHSRCSRTLTVLSRNVFPSSANTLYGPPASTDLREFPVALELRPHSFQFNQCFSSRRSPGEDEHVQDDSSESEESREEFDSAALSADAKEKEAAEIGYTVIGPIEDSDRIFKRCRPVFAVVQVGSHQFKVSNDDCIYTERLKYCNVNDKLLLNKVLLLGSKTQTIIGRPVLPDAAVHAVVEEHALDAKVIVFKKKRRKNYRRTKGHRQELTKLRITNIEGIEVPQSDNPLSSRKQKAESLPHLKIPLKTQKRDRLEMLPAAA